MSEPLCLDCREPLRVHPHSEKYATGFGWSNCYLCPFCRTNRYKSEAHAIARCRAGLRRIEEEAK